MRAPTTKPLLDCSTLFMMFSVFHAETAGKGGWHREDSSFVSDGWAAEEENNKDVVLSGDITVCKE